MHIRDWKWISIVGTYIEKLQVVQVPRDIQKLYIISLTEGKKRKVWLYQKGNEKSRKDRQYNGIKKAKGQTTIYKTIHRKLKIEQHDSHKNNWGELMWLEG